MKTKNLLNITLAFIVSIAFFSCVEDDDFSIPNSLGIEENEKLNGVLDSINAELIDLKTISEVKGFFVEDQAVEFISDVVVKGYVTSSDQSGNFYKEFYLQDAPENPTDAIKVILNQTDSYNQFNFGREVYIRLKGLYIGETNTSGGIGPITIGGKFDTFNNEILEISSNQIPNHLLRSTTTEELVPMVIDPTLVSDANIGMLVTFENVQFPKDLEGKPFVDPADDFDTQRVIELCLDENTPVEAFLLETSSFANFSNLTMPSGTGTITGVVSKEYEEYDRVLYINSVDDISFSGERCGPVFSESFGSAIDGTTLNLPDWINHAEAGSVLWTEQVYSGNGYAEFNPYNSGDDSNISWLISPGIDLDAQEGEILTFETEHAYPDSGHDPLDVMISTDFNGTTAGIESATWTPLTFDVSYIVDYGSWFNFTESGDIDLSGYSGTAYIAFRYTGSDNSNQNMTLHVDNVLIIAP